MAAVVGVPLEGVPATAAFWLCPSVGWGTAELHAQAGRRARRTSVPVVGGRHGDAGPDGAHVGRCHAGSAVPPRYASSHRYHLAAQLSAVARSTLGQRMSWTSPVSGAHFARLRFTHGLRTGTPKRRASCFRVSIG